MNNDTLKVTYRPEIKSAKLKTAFKSLTIKGELRVLEIGDLHEPFCLDEYLDHCIKTYNEFNCNAVVFIGDVIDHHYSSFHGADPDGHGGRMELKLAIERLSRWYKAFPNAYVTIGNHDRIICRKAFAGGIPSEWIKDYNEVLKTPNWDFVHRVVINNVQYVHGEGGTAKTKAKSDMMSTVQGHLHSQLYTEYQMGVGKIIFGKQLGCGIDFEKYAFAYAKAGKRPALGCGVTIGERISFNVPMIL